MELIDAHCHFDFPRFDDCRAAELEAARAQGMSRLVIPGVRRADWARVLKTANAHEGLYYCLGIHPWFVAEHAEEDLEELRRQLVARPAGCVAVGECGLDRLHGSLDEQWPWFEAQINLASELALPLVVHSVKTHDEIHGCLRQRHWSGRALIHGFSGSKEQAGKLADLGCFIGIGGVITHSRARKTREAVAGLPLDCLVLETDAPDMAPEGVGKGRNSPAYLPQIFRALAGIRPEPEDVLARALIDNACRLYGWPGVRINE